MPSSRLRLPRTGRAGLALAVIAASLTVPLQSFAQAPAPKPPAQTSASAEPGKAKAGKPAAKPGGASEQAILVLVNDEPVTAFEVDQRSRLNALGANLQEKAQENFKRLVQAESTNNQLRAILEETVKANQGKTREQILAIFEQKKQAFALNLQKQAVEGARQSVLPGLRKASLEELIEERLKMQEAKKQNAIAEDAEVDRVIANLAERNKLTPEQFAQHIQRGGADVSAMKTRYKVTLSWNEVIRRKFGHQVAITQRDVDRFVAGANSVQDQVELQLQRIIFLLPAKFDQRQIAERMQDAEKIQAKFNGCKGMKALIKDVPATRYEEAGWRRPSAVVEPTRSMLLAAKDDEVVAPSVTQVGVELWAVCGRKVVKAAEEKVAQAQDELRQREFELIAKRHLKDLRQDATIEYR